MEIKAKRTFEIFAHSQLETVEIITNLTVFCSGI